MQNTFPSSLPLLVDLASKYSAPAAVAEFVPLCSQRETNLYKSCILPTEFDRPPNLVKEGNLLYPGRAGPAWDFGVHSLWSTNVRINECGSGN